MSLLLGHALVLGQSHGTEQAGWLEGSSVLRSPRQWWAAQGPGVGKRGVAACAGSRPDCLCTGGEATTWINQIGGLVRPAPPPRPALRASGQWRLMRAFSETAWIYPRGWPLSSLPKSWMTKYRLELAPFSHRLPLPDFVAC